MNELTKEQSKTLTLLKGFAILLVVIIHCDIRKSMVINKKCPKLLNVMTGAR